MNLLHFLDQVDAEKQHFFGLLGGFLDADEGQVIFAGEEIRLRSRLMNGN